MARNFCYNCGATLELDDRFCGECGSTIDQSTSYQYSKPITPSYDRSPSISPSPSYSYPPTTPYRAPGLPYKRRTGWLTFVLAINWIVIVLMGLGGYLFYLIVDAFSPENGDVGLSFLLIISVIVGLLIWVTMSLSKYSNTARIVMLILAGIGFVGGLALLDPFTLVIAGLIIYALGFHKETVALFTTPLGSDYRQPLHYE